MHESAAAGVSRKIVEERDHKFPILRQDRPDDDTPAIGQVHHVNQLSRIVILVSHCINSPMPCWQIQGAARGGNSATDFISERDAFHTPFLGIKFGRVSQAVTLARVSEATSAVGRMAMVIDAA